MCIPRKTNTPFLSDKIILNKICLIRDQKVMMASDLAFLYGVDAKVFNQSVKRNLKRFPPDFMFRLTQEEFENLRSQIVTSSSGWGGARYLPLVFTEQGVAMLSSILNTDRAIEVNIQIIRLFTRMRELVLTNRDILSKVEQLERKVGKNDEGIRADLSIPEKITCRTPATQAKSRVYTERQIMLITNKSLHLSGLHIWKPTEKYC